MWPRVVVVPFLAIALPMASAEAHPEPELSAVSGDAGVFHLLDSETVDGGENADDEARGISVAPDGEVFAAGYITVTGQGRNIWLGKYSEDLVYQDSVTSLCCINTCLYGSPIPRNINDLCL